MSTVMLGEHHEHGSAQLRTAHGICSVGTAIKVREERQNTVSSEFINYTKRL